MPRVYTTRYKCSRPVMKDTIAWCGNDIYGRVQCASGVKLLTDDVLKIIKT